MHHNSAKKIVIIDDDVDLTKEFEQILTEAGYAVIVSATPLFSREKIDFMPDAVLVDIWLQGEPTGLGEVAAMHQLPALAQVPVILISSDPNVAEYTRTTHATTYLIKPIDPEKLMQTLEQVLSHSSGP